jgi:hypothetical protein
VLVSLSDGHRARASRRSAPSLFHGCEGRACTPPTVARRGRQRGALPSSRPATSLQLVNPGQNLSSGSGRAAQHPCPERTDRRIVDALDRSPTRFPPTNTAARAGDARTADLYANGYSRRRLRVTGLSVRQSAHATSRRDPYDARTPRSFRPARRAATSNLHRCRADSTDRRR